MTDRPPRGRPRSQAAEQAIVDTTLDLLGEDGVHGLSVEAVAARAGVGKATIYRRWANKEELVGDALATLVDDIPQVLPGATIRDQLVAMVDHIRCAGSESRSGQVFPRMISYKHSHPEFFQIFARRVLAPRRERLTALVRQGVAAGEIRPDVDVELATTLLLAPMQYLNLAAMPQRHQADVAAQLVDMTIGGLSPRP